MMTSQKIIKKQTVNKSMELFTLPGQRQKHWVTLGCGILILFLCINLCINLIIEAFDTLYLLFPHMMVVLVLIQKGSLYLTMLTRVKNKLCICPVFQMPFKIQRVLPWSMPHPAAKFHDDRTSSFFTIMSTDKQPLWDVVLTHFDYNALLKDDYARSRVLHWLKLRAKPEPPASSRPDTNDSNGAAEFETRTQPETQSCSFALYHPSLTVSSSG